jgi:tRNA threonylcarbamoyladenosine biosynthesis protein TsaE
MPDQHASFPLASPEDTARFAVMLGGKLTAGDTVLLEGPVGSGKTHFARSLIQSLLPVAEDVPSPTFTLVQTYDSHAGAIWHADLYRIASVHEIEELGLAEAFETAICLVEWPDRLGPLAPKDALTLTFAQGREDDAREIAASWSHPRWASLIANGTYHDA